MKIGICDDDKIWLKNAKRMIENYGKKTGMETEIYCYDSTEELNSWPGPSLDVIFMDIVLEEETKKDVTGIDLAAQINAKWKDCQIVYLTNYLYYATEVYHTNHVFFMLKEQFEKRIGEIFGKVLHELAQSREKLVFSVIKGGEISLAPADILCFERSGRKTNLVTVYGVYEIKEKIAELVKQLPEVDFIRCHNSYIVYLPAVREMLSDLFVLNDGRQVMISRSYRRLAKEAFMRWALTQIS